MNPFLKHTQFIHKPFSNRSHRFLEAVSFANKDSESLKPRSTLYKAKSYLFLAIIRVSPNFTGARACWRGGHLTALTPRLYLTLGVVKMPQRI